MNGRRVLTVVVAVCLVTTAMTVGGAAPVEPATAQDDDVPSIPGVYYGELSVTDGSLDGAVTIQAVADGEVQDTLRTDADGTFGGPAAEDDALVVQEPDSGEVEFRIAGTPVTITSLENESIGGTTMPWDSGTQEVMLEADAETVAPSLEVAVTNAPTSIEAGSDATIDVDVDNTGPVDSTQDIELVDSNGTVVDSESVTVPIGNTTSTSLTWTTDDTMSGTETLTVRSGQDSENVTVEVEAAETAPIAPPPSGGGGAGGNPGAIDDQPAGDDTSGGDTDGNGTSGDDTGTVETPGSLTESQTIVTSEDFGLSQVRFTNDSNIVAITWEGTDVNGSVTTTAFNRAPENVSAVPGAMATVSEVTVPNEIANESAIVEQRVARERVQDIDANVADLQAYRYTDGTWEPVPTTVSEESDDGIILESEVPGFSYFAVSAVSEPTAAFDAPSEVTTGENVTLDASTSTDTYGDITAYDWTVDGESLSGETATTTFETTGEVTVELVVTNDAGETNTTTSTISVVEASDGTDADADGDAGGGGKTDDSTPGFTGGLAVLALLVSLVIARRTD